MPSGLSRRPSGDRKAEPYHPEILRHPFRAVGEPKPSDERVFLLSVERDHERAAESDDGLIWVIGTDGSEDRHGSVLNPGGWEIESYLRNPALQFGHDQKIPMIGNTVPKRVGGRWEFGMRFAVDEWKDTGVPNLPLLLRNLYLNDVMRAVSVSFLPKEWKDREAETIPSWFAENIQYTRQELTELSCVNVPSNRNALKKALGDGVVSEREIDFLGFGSFLRLELPALVSSMSSARIPPADPVGYTLTITEKSAEVPTPDAAPKIEARDWISPTTPLTAEYAPEVQAAEIAALAEMAEDALGLIDSAIARWRGAQSDPLRWSCHEQVTNGLYWYELAYEWSRDWYGVTLNDPALAADVLDSLRAVIGIGTRDTTPEFRELAEHVRRDSHLCARELPAWVAARADMVLNGKKQRKLQKAMELIGECLADESAPAVSESAPVTEPADADSFARSIEIPKAPVSELDEMIRNIGGPTDDGSARNSTPQESVTGAAPTKSRFDLMLSDLHP